MHSSYTVIVKISFGECVWFVAVIVFFFDFFFKKKNFQSVVRRRRPDTVSHVHNKACCCFWFMSTTTTTTMKKELARTHTIHQRLYAMCRRCKLSLSLFIERRKRIKKNFCRHTRACTHTQRERKREFVLEIFFCARARAQFIFCSLSTSIARRIRFVSVCRFLLIATATTTTNNHMEREKAEEQTNSSSLFLLRSLLLLLPCRKNQKTKFFK